MEMFTYYIDSRLLGLIWCLPELLFKNNRYVPIVGTMASGIPYLGGPVMAVFVRRYQHYRLYIVWIDWPLCILGLFAGSFAKSLGSLIFTQGIIYGGEYESLSKVIYLTLKCVLAGFVIFYYPIISIVNEWWIARRGTAFGVITSAAGASGIAMPLIIEAMLDRYGYRMTLRAIAVAMVVLTGPLIPLMRSRLPPSQASAVTRTDWSFASQPLFLVYCFANLAQGLGFFFPSLFLPSYATSIGLTARQGALLLSMMSAAQVVGQWTFGILSDKVGLNPLVLLSTIVAAVACFTSWGFAHDLAPLVLFSLLFGFFAYGFSSMRARMGMAVSEEPTAALATFGTLNFCQGSGNVLAGPISAGLLSEGVQRNSYGIMRYKALVVFTGGCMLLSALSIASWYVRPRRLWAR